MDSVDDELNDISCRWLAASGIEHREWDDELLVYAALTGDTHRLESQASAVLLALLETPRAVSVLELHALVFGANAADAHEAKDEVALLSAALRALEQTGLVERAPP